jgi:hypothetical protein
MKGNDPLNLIHKVGQKVDCHETARHKKAAMNNDKGQAKDNGPHSLLV